MSNTLISFFIAAGVGGFVYSKMGRRIGYGNSRSVWLTVAVAFCLAFLFMWTLLHYLIHLS